MDLTSKETGFPLFHCVDLDWRQEGFIFQYSPAAEEEASMTINVLLSLLKHHHPKAEVPSNFTDDEAYRCQSMEWNEAQQMIIDLNAPDETIHISQEEELGGFVFDLDGLRKLQERPKPTPTPFLPHDEDSVSTLQTNDRTIMSTATNLRSIKQISNTQPSFSFTPVVHDSSTVNSQSTELTMESFQQLDSRITGLTSQMMLVNQNNNKNQFSKIMGLLHQLTNSSKASQPTGSSEVRRENENSSDKGE